MIVDYQFIKSGEPLPALERCLYQYLVGQDGIYIRSERPGLKTMFCVESFLKPINGLDRSEEYIEMSGGLVPLDLTTLMLQKAQEMGPREILFYLLPPADGYNWRLATPRQHITRASCRPADPYHPWSQQALIEVHSHNDMGAFFSGQDTEDEKTGFRIYAVLGRVNQAPEIVCRVGVFGHFWDIPAHWIFDLPGDFRQVEDDLEQAQRATMDFRPNYSGISPANKIMIGKGPTNERPY